MKRLVDRFMLPVWASAIGMVLFNGNVAAAEPAIPLKNPGMEQGNDQPADWQKGLTIPGVVQTWDRTVAHSGKASLCLKKTAQRYFPIAEWKQSMAVEPVTTARKLRVRCWAKAENVTKATIDISYQAKAAGHAWAAYIGQKQPTDPVAAHDWKLYEGTVEVPAQTSKLEIAFQIYGPGTVWFDDLEVAWIE